MTNESATAAAQGVRPGEGTPLGNVELKALLEAERSDAIGVNAGTLEQERTQALDYYHGRMADMPTLKGRSAAISTDVADTIEGMMPPLMDIMAGSDEVCRFNPQGPEDVEAAEQESDYLNHIFMQRNDGFITLYSFIKDALLEKLGVVKAWWEEQEREEEEQYQGLDDDTFSMLAAEDSIEIVEHEETEVDGQILHNVKLSIRKTYGCAKVAPVPPEEFGIAKRTRRLRDTHYCFHEVPKAEDDLIQQGYDRDLVDTLPTWATPSRASSNSRDTVEDSTSAAAADTVNKAMRQIKVTEHYIRMDYEQVGRASLYRVTTGGDDLVVLTKKGKPDVIKVSAIPFAAMTPVILTHRIYGRSIAELVIDIQRIKTALLRAMLDNAYMASNQRHYIAENLAGDSTIDDMMINRPGSFVRGKLPNAVMPIPNQEIGSFAYPLLEYIDSTREMRTGVTKQGQGLQANLLQNKGTTAVNQAFTAAQAKLKLVARIFAETGIKDLFTLLHGVVRRNATKADTFRLRNRWVQVDPRGWKTREDMVVQVGLGTGGREQQVAHIMTLIGIQKELALAPDPQYQRLVGAKSIYNSLRKLGEKIDIKSIDPYFNYPDSEEMQQRAQEPPPPDPKVMELQMKSQMEEKKLRLQAQLESVKLQQSAQIETLQAQADIATQQQKVQSEMALAERRFQLEKALKLLDAQITLAEHQAAAEERQAQAERDDFRTVHDEHRAYQAHARDGERSDRMERQRSTQKREKSGGKADNFKALADLIKAPRTTTLVRGKDGKATHSVSALTAE